MANCEKEAELIIAKGLEVEVSSDDVGFKGAWYRATIEGTPSKSKRKKVLVKYASLIEEGGSTPLTESVDSAFIRPLPPLENGNIGDFAENDVVDANLRDGWWTGVVRNVREDSRYWVYFDNPPDVIEFEEKDLRSHFDWIHGKWVRPDKQKPKSSMFRSGTEVEMKNRAEGFGKLWIPAIVIKENEDGTFYVKYMSSRGSDAETTKFIVCNRHIRPTPPPRSVKDYALQEPVETVHRLGWRLGTISKILAGNRYTVSFRPEHVYEEFAHSDLRPHLEWIDGEWVKKPSTYTESFLVEMNREQLESTIAVSGNRESEIVESSLSSYTGKKKLDRLAPCSGSYAVSSGEQIKLRASLGCSKHFINGKTNRGNVSKTQVIAKAGGSMKTPDETPAVQTTPSFDTSWSKSSRTKGSIRSMKNDQLSLIRSSQNKWEWRVCEGSDVCSIDAMTNGKRFGRSSLALAERFKANGTDGNRANEANGEISTKETPELRKDQHKSNNGVAGSKRKGVTAPKRRESSEKKKRGRPLSFISPQLSPARPSSLQSPTGQGENDAADMQIDVFVETPTRDGHSLPFLKRSPIWKTVESMEVFEAVPQSPHFHTLLETKEEYREGTAIGIMISFASLFEKVASLQFDDPRSTIDGVTESFLDLEKYGFDVSVPQDRIKELLSIKDRQAQISGELKDTEREITEEDCKKAAYNEELKEIRDKMAELQKRCKHVKSLVGNKDRKIAKLKSRSNMLNAKIQSQRLEFQKISNSPWKRP